MHPAIAQCPSCMRPLPHDALICACGHLMPWPAGNVDLTASGRAMERLAQLAQDIGWQSSADQLRHVAQAGILHLCITVVPSRRLGVIAEDTLLGKTVREYDSLLSVAAEKRLVAQACMVYLRTFHSPLTMPKATSTRATPRPSDPDDYESMYIGEVRMMQHSNPRALRKWETKFRHRTWLSQKKWRINRRGSTLKITRIA